MAPSLPPATTRTGPSRPTEMRRRARRRALTAVPRSPSGTPTWSRSICGSGTRTPTACSTARTRSSRRSTRAEHPGRALLRQGSSSADERVLLGEEDRRALEVDEPRLVLHQRLVRAPALLRAGRGEEGVERVPPDLGQPVVGLDRAARGGERGVQLGVERVRLDVARRPERLQQRPRERAVLLEPVA